LLFRIIAFLLKGIILFLNFYSWIIVVDAVFILFTRPKDKNNRVKQILRKITNPINNVFRKALRYIGAATAPVDFSPMLSLIVIWIVTQLINQLYKYFINLTYFYY